MTAWGRKWNKVVDSDSRTDKFGPLDTTNQALRLTLSYQSNHIIIYDLSLSLLIPICIIFSGGEQINLDLVSWEEGYKEIFLKMFLQPNNFLEYLYFPLCVLFFWPFFDIFSFVIFRSIFLYSGFFSVFRSFCILTFGSLTRDHFGYF